MLSRFKIKGIFTLGLNGLGYAGNSFILCGKKSSLNELRLEFMSNGSPAWLEISDPKYPEAFRSLIVIKPLNEANETPFKTKDVKIPSPAGTGAPVS